jgi:purine-binding chemotaxis protein CheW
VQAVLLPVHEELYALPVRWVREVLTAPRITPLPTAPSEVLGLFNLRGEIVPLFDTAALLGIGTTDAVAFTVVLLGPQGPAGLATTAFPQRAVLDVPTGRSEHQGTAGTFRIGERVAVLIEPSALLAPDRRLHAGPA